MKFHESSGGGNVFTGHGAGVVRINQVEYRENLLVTPDRVLTGWAPHGLTGLAAADFEQVVALEPELVVVGTGRRQVFPSHAQLQPLIAARIGVEVMDTPAACRTFNILSAEGRKVVAAIVVAEPGAW